MVRQKRYITFYTLHKKHIFPSVYQYGLMVPEAGGNV